MLVNLGEREPRIGGGGDAITVVHKQQTVRRDQFRQIEPEGVAENAQTRTHRLPVGAAIAGAKKAERFFPMEQPVMLTNQWRSVGVQRAVQGPAAAIIASFKHQFAVGTAFHAIKMAITEDQLLGRPGRVRTVDEGPVIQITHRTVQPTVVIDGVISATMKYDVSAQRKGIRIGGGMQRLKPGGAVIRTEISVEVQVIADGIGRCNGTEPTVPAVGLQAAVAQLPGLAIIAGPGNFIAVQHDQPGLALFFRTGQGVSRGQYVGTDLPA